MIIDNKGINNMTRSKEDQDVSKQSEFIHLHVHS